MTLAALLDNAEPFLRDYGYYALGGALFLESLGLPVIGETLLVAASVVAGQGELNLITVMVVAVACAALGNAAGYLVGRRGGHAAVLRWGPRVGLSHAAYARAEATFARYGWSVVLLARFVPILRQVNGIIAGTAEMPWGRFLASNLAGAALWVGVWSGGAYSLGHDFVAFAPWIVVAVVGIVALGVVLFAARHRRPGR